MIWRQIVSRLTRENGDAIVEFAMSLIVFLLLLFGILDFGRALYTYHFVSNTAREATRFAAVHGYTCNTDLDGGSCTPTGGPASASSTAPITDYVSSIVPPGIVSANVATTPTWSTDSNSPAICTTAVNGSGPYSNYPGCTVAVTVTYPFNFLVPLVYNGSFQMSSTSQMVISH